MYVVSKVDGSKIKMDHPVSVPFLYRCTIFFAIFLQH